MYTDDLRSGVLNCLVGPVRPQRVLLLRYSYLGPALTHFAVRDTPGSNLPVPLMDAVSILDGNVAQLIGTAQARLTIAANTN